MSIIVMSQGTFIKLLTNHNMYNKQATYCSLYGWIIPLAIFSFACQPKADKASGAMAVEQASLAAPAAAANFGSKQQQLDPYWHQGKAEISRYALSQHRYRDVHPGEAVLVQVTEDFLTELQVKNERYRNPQSTPVLKTNLIRRFTTGIYDYAIMASVFTPVNTASWPHSLKVTTSVQDWCGQVFGQLNFREGGYQLQSLSYFEGEGDQRETLPAALLEDELFNRIRMDWRSLPTGRQLMIPSLAWLRLLHQQAAPYQVELQLSAYTGDTFKGKQLQEYRVVYPELNRRLSIVFEAESPYYIQGWQEEMRGRDGQPAVSTAVLTHRLLDDYWNHNGLENKELRQKLGM